MKTIELQKYEIETLSQWHREKQWEFLREEDYLEAEYHEKRADELSKLAADA